MLAAAIERLSKDWQIEATSPVIESAPVGPSLRRYANGAIILRGPHDPVTGLALLKQVEREFGQRRAGQRWRTRVLDCDIILWDGGCWDSATLTIPHRLFRLRNFVLRPAAAIAPRWRDPVTGLTIRQLAARACGPQRPGCRGRS